jgi:hypothetical protein
MIQYSVGYLHLSLSSGKFPSDVVVSAAVTELVFPSTKVGTVSSQKIPLQNWSGAKQEVLKFRSFRKVYFPRLCTCILHSGIQFLLSLLFWKGSSEGNHWAVYHETYSQRSPRRLFHSFTHTVPSYQNRFTLWMHHIGCWTEWRIINY